MTLIATAITNQYIIQVSDRRLTNSSNGKPVTDEAIKAVILDWHTVVGYTGLSMLPTSAQVAKKRNLKKPELRTEDWIAEVLLNRPADDDQLLINLQDEAQQSLEKLPLVLGDLRRQAFMGATWANTPGELFPVIWQISNFENVDKYKLEMYRLPVDNSVSTLIHFSSPRVSGGTRKKVRAIRDRVVSPRSMGRILVDMIRHEAKYNPTIGKSVYQVSIPRQYAQKVIDENEYSYVDPEKIIPDFSEELAYKHIEAEENSDKGAFVSPVIVSNRFILKSLTMGSNSRWTVNYPVASGGSKS